MIKHFAKLAARHLRLHLGQSLIKTLSLTVGFVICLSITLYILDEYSFDRFHTKAENIYRVAQVNTLGDGSRQYRAGTPGPLGPALVDELPAVESFIRMRGARQLIRKGDEHFEESILFADDNLFEVFDFQIVAGTGFSSQNDALITEAVALKYFGLEDPIGQELLIEFLDEAHSFTIVGIVQSPPTNSSISFDVLLPFAMARYNDSVYFRSSFGTDWRFPIGETYILTNNVTSVQDALPAFISSRYAGIEDEIELVLQPLPEIHFDDRFTSNITPTDNPLYAYILAGIAFVLMLIACVNFVTISIGQSVERTKEVGVRKIVGAQRFQLKTQFWGEAVLLSVLAFLIGMLVVYFLLPPINGVTGKDLHLITFFDITVIVFLVVLILIVGFFAGAYPTTVLSRLHPISIIRGRVSIGSRHGLMRLLTVGQFVLLICFINFSFIMSDQLDFLLNKDLGFDKENVVVMKHRSFDAGGSYFEAFRSEALQLEAVESVSGSMRSFGDDLRTYYVVAGDSLKILTGSLHVQEDYVSALKIDLNDGRNLTEQIFEDGSGFYGVINEALYRQLGSPELPTTVGIEYKNGRTFAKMTINGVAKDFHTKSLHSPIEPVFLMPRTALGGSLSHFYIRINPENRSHTIDNLRQIWAKITHGDEVRNAGSDTDYGIPFEYMMLDDVIDQHYLQEKNWMGIIRLSTVVMIVVAGFGMFGLSVLLFSRRTHEIGIRKVLGASPTGIFWLLSKESTYTVVLAAVVATPLTYVLVARWLDNFSYPISPYASTFLVSFLVTLGIMYLTICYQTLKTAISNPVKALRCA